MPGNHVLDPEEVVISSEEIGNMEEKITEILSELEWQVLNSYLDGKSYLEIADELQRHVKSVDNALQRVKRKLERYLDSKDAENDSEYASLRQQ
jgi:RNA polymerase sporulation-specific sigma factor